MQVYKSFFQIGVYDPNQYNSWPWHFHYENGKYLSTKKRVCGWSKPAEFDTQEEAREFFHAWKQKTKYKMEIIEIKRWAEIPDPIYPDDHPRNIMGRIMENEKSRFSMVAALWFSGINGIKDYSKTTQLKYREQLLKYGIDIFSEPPREMKQKWEESNDRNYCDLDFKKAPKLKIVTSDNQSA